MRHKESSGSKSHSRWTNEGTEFGQSSQLKEQGTYYSRPGLSDKTFCNNRNVLRLHGTIPQPLTTGGY